MSTSTGGAPIGATRALPSNASLEFERKRAKALLRRLRRKDPRAKLADAQFVVARELGFASWPRLAQYFQALERDVASAIAVNKGSELEYYNGRVRTLLAEHREGREWAGRTLAAFVPRFYGRSAADALASPVSTDDAQLAIARQHRCSSWQQLVDEAAAERARVADPWTRDSLPSVRASRAIEARDINALEQILDEHPELLHPPEDDQRPWDTLMHDALLRERHEPSPETRRVTDWLVARGMDISRPLNSMLLGFVGSMRPADVVYLLDRGADPGWVAPNGLSVLDHAIVRYKNGEALDLIAKRVDHRDAFWIAAALGDAAGVRKYFDRDGILIAAAYADRAPFQAASHLAFPSLPEPEQLELLAEVAWLAATNGRTAVIEVFLDHAFPIDYIGWGGMSLLRVAIGQRDLTMLAMLIRRGADLDKKGEWPHASAREYARGLVNWKPMSPEVPRILEMCGAGTIEDAVAGAERERPSPPPAMPHLRKAFELAGDDAARQDQREIRNENMFIGLMRAELPLRRLSGAGVNLEALRAAIVDRLHPAENRVARQVLPFDPEARATIERAVATAEKERSDAVSTYHVLHALIERGDGFTADLLVACGGDLSRLRQGLERL